MKDKLQRMLFRGKVTVLAVALAVILVAAPAALAANGKPFILGKGNLATKVTKLTGKVASGAALLVSNPSGGPALDLRVKAGKAPMTVNSATRVGNLSADLLDGRDSGAFIASNIYKTEGPVDAGTQIGDGTFVASKACDSGDILLSGGPANINATSTLLESFPSPGSTTSWSVRINKNGQADNFNVVVLCASQ